MVRNVVVLAAVVCACSASAAERGASVPLSDSPAGTGSLRQVAEASAGRLQVGDAAPMFSFIGTDGAWHAFRQRWAGRPVVLVFGAEEQELKDLDAARGVFADLGVCPVAVLDMSSGSASRFVRRVGLECEVVTDVRRAIAELYGSLDALTRRHAPSYFVLDGNGTIRGYRHGALPSPSQLVMATARHLGKPLPESAWLLSSHW